MRDEQQIVLCEEESGRLGDGEVSGAEKGEVGNAKPRLKPINRRQIMLRTVDVERLVEEDHEVRGIWEFVGRLDLSRYYENIRAIEGVAGSKALDPRLLISIWIYAYSKGVSSAREISRLCEYDPAYQWLRHYT